MGATFPRVTVWSSGQDVTHTDLNAEFQNILDNLTPSGADDYSANATQMQIQTSPGAQGSESLATSTAGELARLRYVLNRLIGGTYWYDAPTLSMTELGSLLNSATNIPDNRIVSGRVRSATDSFPIFLVPDGTAATVSLKGATTNFRVYIDGALNTVTTDVTKTGMSLAPSTNNTCLVNDSTFTSQDETKYAGEINSTLPYITIDTVGSEISALVGKYAAFQKGSEYFVAFVNSATQLTRCRRGWFFDSADAPVVRATLADNDTITLKKLHWVFYKNDGTLFTTTTNPFVSADTPASPANGDMWYDLTNTQWKLYNGSSFEASNGHLIGWAITDTAGCKAARSFNFYAPYSSVGSIVLEKYDNATLRGNRSDGRISVAGNMVDWGRLHPIWDLAASGIFDASFTEQSSTDYYFYVTEYGDVRVSPERPNDRRDDLYGHYHPYHMWRAVGYATNDGSSNLGNPTSYIGLTHRGQTFTASGTWLCPFTTYEALIDLVGGGGGGGGGGEGGYADGSGKTAGNGGSGGSIGGNSTFGSLTTSYGGGGGSGGNGGAVGAPGDAPPNAGGTATASSAKGSGGRGGLGGAGTSGAVGEGFRGDVGGSGMNSTPVTAIVSVIPGTAYTVTVGGAGSGGAGGTGNPGTDGSAGVSGNAGEVSVYWRQ